MIRHVALFTWKPEATDEQKRRAEAMIATLPPLMRGLRSFTFGTDTRLAEGNADFAIVADFDDADSYLAYRDHPAHVDVSATAVRPIAAQRTAVQYEI